MGHVIRCATVLALTLSLTALAPRTAPQTPWLIAHRGASAYAPENTIPAFQLAADQGATFVEFDLRLTKDRQIVCLHDDSLERTTDVEEVFPGRSGLLEGFTLAELKRLDAGSWFGPAFRGTRIPTFAETIDALRGRAGLFIELKSPERYEGIERLVLAELKRAGLDEPGADPKTPVLLQSFTASSPQIFTRALRTALPVHFLVGPRDAAPWLTPEGLARVKTFATGLSPEKSLVMSRPDAMKRAREMGLLITPYTFRAGQVSGFPDVRAEMAHYLDVLKVDGVITDNPDRMPARSSNRDEDAIGQQMHRAIEVLGAGVVRLKTPDGTALQFRVGHRPLMRQDGALRVAPQETKVYGTLVVPEARFGEFTATDVRFFFQYGRGRAAEVKCCDRQVPFPDAATSAPLGAFVAQYTDGVPFGEFAVDFIPPRAGAVRVCVGDNGDLGGAVKGAFGGPVRCFDLRNATVETEAGLIVRDGVLQ